ELAFEGGDLVAEHVLAALQHALDHFLQFVLDRLVLGLQIEIRNHATYLLASSSMTRPRVAIDCDAASRSRTTRRPASPLVRVRRFSSTHAMKCRASCASASVMSICGAHMSPDR